MPKTKEEEKNTEELSTKDILDSVKLEGTDLPQLDVEAPSESQQLYDELSSFLKKKEISPDQGIKLTIPTGIKVLDAILGGGFAVGALNIIVGQPGSGKSMLAIQTLASCQQVFPGSLVGFLDSEEATTTIRLANLGVRFPKIKPYIDITVEKVFRFIEGLCLFKDAKKLLTPSALVWDSIANTVTEKERETEDPNQVIGYRARLLSILLPRYVTKISHYNIALIAVNQLRDTISIGPMQAAKSLKFLSAGKNMPGGNVIQFNAFTLVEMKVKEVLKKEMYGFDGIKVEAKTVKNKLFMPNMSVMLVGDFVTGFSDFWTSYEFLKKTKRLNASAWNYLTVLPTKKFRTKDGPNLYKTDAEFKEMFDKEVEEAIKFDIVEKESVELENGETNQDET